MKLLFFSPSGKKMIERFELERSAKISDSDRFSTYHIFKSVLQAGKYFNDITIKKFRDTLIRLRLGINEMGLNKLFST